jgi:hypothetical protein
MALTPRRSLSYGLAIHLALWGLSPRIISLQRQPRQELFALQR